MTNLTQLSTVSNHFTHGKLVSNNAVSAQKNAPIQCTDVKKTSYNTADATPSKLRIDVLTNQNIKDNSKLIAKIKEYNLPETSKFADHLFQEHKKKLIELVQHNENLDSISCVHEQFGDLYFLIQMFKLSHKI